MALLGQSSFSVLERTTPKYQGDLVDDTGNVIQSSSLTSLTLTVYDVNTGSILNSRDKQNVLNLNNVSIDSSGHLVWIVQVQDLAIVNTDNLDEVHMALFEWSWNTGTRFDKHEVELKIRNLSKVP